MSLSQDNIDKIERYTPEERLRYLVKEVVSHKQIWILTDEDGCVMLNSEDEDCAPVWPNQEFAQSWATGEWQDCEPKAISLKSGTQAGHKGWKRMMSLLRYFRIKMKKV